MKQILAIFRKDARHFWPETLVSLGLLAALVGVYPQQWRRPIFFETTTSYSAGWVFTGGANGFLAGLLVVLIPVSWWIMIARSVHADRLVGYTQAWLTRPYEWPLLLAAKLIFLAVFVYLPFFATQCILLAIAGFHPLAYLPGLGFNLLLLTGSIVLPLLALATLTSSFARMVLAILGVLLFIAGVAAAAGMLPTLGGTPDLIGGDIALALLICATGAVILVQYSSRRQRTGWLLLAAAALLIGADALLDPDQPLMNHYYPAPSAGDAAPALFQYAAHGMNQPVTHATEHHGIVEVSIPVRITGVATGSVVIPMALKATLEGADGSHWESPWESIAGEHYLPGSTDSVFRFKMRRRDFDYFLPRPGRLHLVFAVDVARVHGQTAVPLPQSGFDVPGFAICAPQAPWPSQPINGIACRSAMRPPDLTYVTVQWSEIGCPSSRPALKPQLQGTAWAGSLNSAAAEFGIISVWNVPLSLSNSWTESSNDTERRYHMRELCAGSVVSFTTYTLQGRARVNLDSPDFRLPEISQASLFSYSQ